LDRRLLVGLEIEARKRGLTVQQVIYAMVEGYLAAKVGPVISRAPLGAEALEKVIITKLRLLLGQLRFEIAAQDLTTIRRNRINDLDKAARQLNKMVEETKSLDKRLKIYQVMGYLCQIIDGLVTNAEKDELTRIMKEMEKRLELLEASRQVAQGNGATPPSPSENRDK